jgi:uncharacterized ParB-like nuclease family protein
VSLTTHRKAEKDAVLDLSKFQNLSGYSVDTPRSADNNVRLVHSALHRFEKALNEARLRRFWARFLRRSNSLINLGQYHLQISGCHYAGVREVPIAEIRGSEGRAGEFDDHFRPLSERSSERWTSIAIARADGVPLPPVDLVQVGRYYFVRDGHHRISVGAKAGQECIEAEVTVMDVEGLLPWEVRSSPRRSRKIGVGTGYGAYFAGR